MKELEKATESTRCEACGTPLEKGDLRCSICGKAAPLQSGHQKKTVVEILRCTGCGAAVAYDPKRQAPACSFCGSVYKVETIEDPMEQTSGYLPFTVTPEQAKQELRRWLGSLGWFRPSDLRSAARLQELQPLWWVAWVFDASARISWTADSNHGARRSAWAPHAGQTTVSFNNILASASRGLASKEVDAISNGFDLTSAQPDPQGATNATLEQFDVQRSQARQQVTQVLQHMAGQHVQHSEIPGSKFRNMHVSVVVRDLITRRLSFPAYVMAYRYKNQLYRVVICGQDPRLVFGDAPLSAGKIALVVFGVATIILLFLAILA
ncbi:MAG: hypothetical protein AAGD07_03785 [Planctomycetota bacterium]